MESRAQKVDETKWTKAIPKKIEILLWRGTLGRIACREVLDKMGIDLDTTFHPRCALKVQLVDRALFRRSEKYMESNNKVVESGHRKRRLVQRRSGVRRWREGYGEMPGLVARSAMGFYVLHLG